MHWAIRRKKTTMGRKKCNVLTVSHNLKKKCCTSLRIKTIVWREKSWDYRCNFEKKSHNLKVTIEKIEIWRKVVVLREKSCNIHWVIEIKV